MVIALLYRVSSIAKLDCNRIQEFQSNIDRPRGKRGNGKLTSEGV